MAGFESKFLKYNYVDNKKLSAVADRASPFVAQLNKPVDGGKAINEPLIFSGPKGNSYSLSAAQAVAAQSAHGASDYQEFSSPFGQYFGVANVTAKAVAGGRTNKESYLRQIAEVLESEVKSFISVAARKLLGPIGGSIGRISDLNEGGTDGQLQLTVEGDALNFAPGMILQAADGTGNGAPSNVRSGLGYVFRVAPNADITGSSTTGAHVFVATSEANSTAGTAGGPTGWVDNDYLFRNGDVQASTDLSDSQIRSFQGWITLTAAADSYLGVTRSADGRYSGFRLSAAAVAGMSILDRIQLLATTGAKQCGAMPDLCVLGPTSYQQLAQEVQSYGAVAYTDNVKIGVKLMTVLCSTGAVQVLMDPHAQESDIWLFTSETLKLYHYGPQLPNLQSEDGVEFMRQATAAGYEIRWEAFTSATVSGRPHHNGRCDSGNT